MISIPKVGAFAFGASLGGVKSGLVTDKPVGSTTIPPLPTGDSTLGSKLSRLKSCPIA
jgi:hypothetical protein